MRARDIHDYSFRPVSYLGDALGEPYLVTVTRSDDPSEEPVAELPYPEAYERYGDCLWPEVLTCGTCGARFPAITPASRCPFEGVHPDPDDEGSPVPPLYKTTVVVWSQYPGDKLELSSLAFQAEQGDAVCTRYGSVLVPNPAADPDWEPVVAEAFEDALDDDEEDGDGNREQ